MAPSVTRQLLQLLAAAWAVFLLLLMRPATVTAARTSGSLLMMNEELAVAVRQGPGPPGFPKLPGPPPPPPVKGPPSRPPPPFWPSLGGVTTTTVLVTPESSSQVGGTITSGGGLVISTPTPLGPADTLAPASSSIASGPTPPPTISMSSPESTLRPSAGDEGSSTPPSSSSSDISSNRTLVITLSAVLSSVVVLLIAGAILCCRRYRRGRRIPFFNRGITPIDDDEIERWKISPEDRDDEKRGNSFSHEAFSKEASLDPSDIFGGGPPLASGAAAAPATAAAAGSSSSAAAAAATAAPGSASSSPTRHAKGASTGSAKKAPAAVIVYQPNPPRRSEDLSPRSFASSAGLASGKYGRLSLDKDLPQTPVQARAPNARAGLTDEAIPGDEPFLPTPKRQPSRISKMPPLTSPRAAHTRARSSRGSMRSLGGGGGGDHHHGFTISSPTVNNTSPQNNNNPYSGYGHNTYYGSQHELHHRASSDYPRGSSSTHAATTPSHTPSHSHHGSHSGLTSSSQQQGSPGYGSSGKKHGRVYSTSSVPPRLSLSEDYGSPRRPSLRDDIGLAIG